MIAMGKRLVLLFVVMWLAACGEVRIDQPANNSVSPDLPATFQVTFVNGKAPAGLKIVLNTNDVTSLFAVTDTGATSTGALLQQHIFSGRNQFSVAATGVAKKEITFYHDTEGPTVHLLQGRRTDGSVSGYLADIGGVASLSIDGQNIPLDGSNRFTAIVQNLPVNEFVTVDDFGNTSTLSLARNDMESSRAMSARLNNTGLGFLGDVLEEVLGGINFEALMVDLNPIVDLNLLGLARLQVNVQDLSFGQPSIDLAVLDNERLDTDVYIPNFSMGINVAITTGICPFCITVRPGGTLYMDSVSVNTNVLLDIVNQDLAVDLAGTRAFIDVNRLDINGLPNILGIENLAGEIVGAITNFLMPFFTGIIDTVVDQVVTEFISDIPVALTITTAENEKLRIRALPQYLDTFDNSLTIDLGASVRAPEPSSAAVPQWGSHYVAGDTPTIGATTPDGEPFDIGASISSNLINQALFAAHESGITTMTIRPDNTPGTDPEGVSVVQGEGDDIQTADLIGMRLEPASAPFIKLMDRQGAYGILGWYDVKLSFDMRRVGWTDYRQVFSMTFNLEVPFELGATDDGFLHLGLEQLPTIEVLTTEYQGLIPLTPRFMNGIIERFMPLVLPKIADRLKAVPLPRIAGHYIHPKEFWISGESGNNLSFAGGLVKVSTTEAAPRPRTLLSFSGGSQTVPGTTAGATTSTVKAAAATISQEAITVANGRVTINVSGNNPSVSFGALEYRYRVDNGPWSIWKPRNRIEMANLLGGDHVVEVCSRTVLMKQEQGCPTVNFTTAVQ